MILATCKDIDAEIMALRRKLSLHEDDYDQVQEIGNEIEKLRQLRETWLHPWQKPRPVNEASLSRYGVIV